MRSEKLIRLGADEPARHYGNERERERIAAQVEAFLAAGGEIEQIPSHIGTCPEYGFGRAPSHRVSEGTQPQAPNGRA